MIYSVGVNAFVMSIVIYMLISLKKISLDIIAGTSDFVRAIVITCTCIQK